MCLGGLSKDYNKNSRKTQDYMEIFMTLVLIIEPLQMMKY